MPAPSRSNPHPSSCAHERAHLVSDLRNAGFALGAPAFMRIFKREKRLELWLARDDGRFTLFRAYAICHFSGQLGPKLAEGDMQAPEGFYRVAQKQLNPNSRHHLAFNLGFPNAYDRALNRTGSALMVHGGCTSTGCYAMTDAYIDQIYAIVEAALKAGQTAIDVHALPFVMSDKAMRDMHAQPWLGFWQNLKRGYDLFEAERIPPRIGACNGEYCFGPEVGTASCVEIGYWGD